jgi:hypothetical protein
MQESYVNVDLDNFNYMYTPIGSNAYLVTLTGTANIGFPIVPPGVPDNYNYDDWIHGLLNLKLPFPNLICPPGECFQIEQTVPFFSICGLEKGGDNHNGGWALNDFKASGSGEKIMDEISMSASIYVRGSQFSLFRVSFSLNARGTLALAPWANKPQAP